MKIDWISEGFMLGTQLIIILLFLLILFLIYIKNIERHALELQTKFIVDDIASVIDLNKLIKGQNTKKFKDDIYNILDDTSYNLNKEYEQEVKEIRKSNQHVVWVSIGIIGLLCLIIAIAFGIVMWKGYGINVDESLTKNMLLFLISTVVQIIFLSLVVKRYISPNNIKLKSDIGDIIVNYVNSRTNKN